MPPSAEELALKRRIDELYTAYPFYGSRKIAVVLGLNRKLAQRYTLAPALQVQVCARWALRVSFPVPTPASELPNTGFSRIFCGIPPPATRITSSASTHMHRNASAGVTYIRLRAGSRSVYLVAVLDWYSRYVLAWELSDTLELPFVLSCARVALAQAKPQIWNSDQGSHFTSPQYTELLLGAGVQISMDGRGRFRDNIFTERLWRTVKYEEVYLTEYANPREARQGLGHYFQFYNGERPHQALGYLTPAAVYFG